MKLLTIPLICLSLIVTSAAMAGPEDPSSAEGTAYTAPQKVVFDAVYDNPGDMKAVLATVSAHIRALKEHGNPPVEIVVVSHGNELNGLARANRTRFPDMYDAVRQVTGQGVRIHICGGAARLRGYGPADFYDFVTVVPVAPTDLAKLEGEGYAYVRLGSSAPRITRDDLAK
ncbi:MAG: hypothetical protein F8N37_05715 [Telmatospirillum sp.]|nr:hypothetical protein [Telmatospirillum sp.]